MLGNDFPNNLLEFEKRFYTEDKCREHLYKAEFPDGFICPKCGNKDFWWTKRKLLHCKNCGHQESLRTGTIMEGSKKPFMYWYRAIFLVAFQKVGISAKNLQNQLGFGSYQTAWCWLQKIRLSMRRINREPLKEEVEVDETEFGGSAEGKRGRGAENKELLAVSVEKNGKKLGRIRIEKVTDASYDSLLKFINDNVENGAIIKTDGWKGYEPLLKTKYNHIVLKKKKDKNLLPAVNLVISLFKRWTLGIHQGLVKGKHLQLYIDEFVFRFNRRKSKSRGKVFYRLLDQVISYKVKPYWEIVGRSKPNVPLKRVA